MSPSDSTADAAQIVDGIYSDLWGKGGELWSPHGRLPDFSFAGYRSGEVAIPDLPAATNVRDFGAVGDGVADDTSAFENAIAATTRGAIVVPAGRYRITRVLKLTRSDVVLRGAGAGATTLFFPRSLREVLGTAPAWAGNGGAWSWGGGFLWLGGTEQGVQLANVTAAAERGDTVLTLDSTSRIRPGSMVRLLEFESDGSLGRHLHGELASAGSAAPRKLVDFASEVVAVSGNQITLERPLRADVRPGWTPQIHSFSPSVQNTGVEELTVEFPNTAYAGHLLEAGYNAIQLDGVANCWVRNVTILDADNGIVSGSASQQISRFCTIEGVRMANQWRPATSVSGHHGIAFENPQDSLVTDFRFDKMFTHDLTVDWASAGNVFADGSGVNLNFDHHRYVPYENLFTDIDVGTGNTLWLGSRTTDSGNADGGPPSAARETFWNIRGTAVQTPLPNWPQLTIVGMTQWPTQRSTNLWVENIAPASVQPRNLYTAQLARRLGTPIPTPTSIQVTPATANVLPGQRQQFTATVLDQSGAPMAPQPVLTWSVSGGGTITNTGLFTATTTGGPFTISASSAGRTGTASVTVTPSETVPPTETIPPSGNGDGVDTIGVYVNGAWYLRNSNSPGPPDIAVNYGTSGYTAVVGDWNGDGVDTIGVSVNGAWYLRNSNSPGPPDIAVNYGTSGYTAVVGDWNGDGVDTIGVSVNGAWYLRNSNSPGPPDIAVNYGTSGYTAVVGDWNGDGVDTIGVYVNGAWYLRNSNSPGPPDIAVNYGTSGYTAVVGDWNGDGVDTIGVYVNGAWYLRNSNSPGPPDIAVNYGTSGYTAVVGDWNGDGDRE